MKKVVIGMLASGVAALFFVSSTPACSSSVDCNAKACSGDPDPSAAAIKACEDAKAASTCTSEYNDAYSCIQGEDLCTDNKSDAAKATAALSKCAEKLKAYTTCAAGATKADGG